MSETYVQRMRVTFATSDTMKYVGHLDMARAWERAIRRARLPLAYSQGFNPQARMHFAAALPVGFIGLAELVDVFLDESLAPDEFLARLAPALPSGIRLTGAQPVARELPALQAAVSEAYYRVEVETAEPDDAFNERLAGFMTRSEAWRERRRGKEMARYDLRPLVQSLAYAGRSEIWQCFETMMRVGPAATGRPDELLAELGYESALRRISRLRLMLRNDGPSIADSEPPPSGSPPEKGESPPCVC